jgi:hypothetical protein
LKHRARAATEGSEKPRIKRRINQGRTAAGKGQHTLDDPAAGSAKVADMLKRLEEGIAKTRKCESAKARKVMGYDRQKVTKQRRNETLALQIARKCGRQQPRIKTDERG